MEAFSLTNRKYLGSKRLLAPCILDAILREAGLPELLLDGFAGTGSVAAEALARGARRVVAVDNLASNTAILRGFACSSGADGPSKAVGRRIEELNALDGVEGYVTRSFAGTYFTAENCRRMDSARERIELWLAAGDIDAGEHAELLAGFLLGADRVANTVGQYDAFLKHLGSAPMRGGRHLVDGRVYTPFRVLPLAPLPDGILDVLTGDVVALAPGIHADVAYLDPPYNSRQYCDCYHVLENLARWEKPALAGKTRKFARDGLKSSFSSRRTVRDAFSALLDAVRAPHVYVSYSSEGLLEPGEVEALMRGRGAVTMHRFPYPVFGSGAGVARRREVTEYLYHLERTTRDGSGTRRRST
jgi:adenine-specific DNA-methyltransferase